MVGFDLRGDAGDAGGFDDIGINRALGQPAGAFDPLGIGVEGLDEQAADGLALGFRFGHALQGFQEGLRGVGTDDVEAHIPVRGHDVLEFILPEQAVVDEDAGQLRSDRFVKQHGRDGRIDTAAQAEDDPVVPDLRPEFRDGRVDERRRGPVPLAAADAEGEVREHLRALFCVVHFRMELHGKHLIISDLIGGIHDVCGRGDHFGAPGQRGDRVPVGHPDLGFGRYAFQEG